MHLLISSQDYESADDFVVQQQRMTRDVYLSVSRASASGCISA